MLLLVSWNVQLGVEVARRYLPAAGPIFSVCQTSRMPEIRLNEVLDKGWRGWQVRSIAGLLQSLPPLHAMHAFLVIRAGRTYFKLVTRMYMLPRLTLQLNDCASCVQVR